MILNIIFISLIIIILFFMSNDEKINNISNKKSIKILFLLIIIYFVYQNYNLLILLIAFIIFIVLTIDFKNIKIDNNLLKIFIYNSDDSENSTIPISDNNSLSNKENPEDTPSRFDGKEYNINKFADLDFFKNYSLLKNKIYSYFKNYKTKEHFTFKPYVSEKNKSNTENLSSTINTELFLNSNNDQNSDIQNIEPFKEDVKKIKEMYENIRMEINRLNT